MVETYTPREVAESIPGSVPPETNEVSLDRVPDGDGLNLDKLPEAESTPAREFSMEDQRINALVLAAQGGDVRAKEELYEMMKWLIAGIAKRYFNYAEGYTEEDIRSSANVFFLQAINEFKPKAPFSYFAQWYVKKRLQTLVTHGQCEMRNATNAGIQLFSIDSLDRDTVSDKSEDNEADDPFLAFTKNATPDEFLVFVKEIGLTEIEAKAITLHRAGMPYKQIAAKLECGEKMVDNAMQRAIPKLRNYAEGRVKKKAIRKDKGEKKERLPSKFPPEEISGQLSLTLAEKTVLGLRQQGKSNQEIAVLLNIKLPSVERYNTEVTRKWKKYIAENQETQEGPTE